MADLDSGLTPNDLRVFIRADTSDTGPQPGTNARGARSIWWLSPDIILNGGTNLAQQGIANTVQVKFILQSAFPAGVDNNIRVEFWVGNPALSMTPGSNTIQRGSALKVPLVGSNARNFTWTLPTPLPAFPDPESEGHKCLIARCYPDTLTPEGTEFHQMEDPHVSQRNICIVSCSSPCSQDITTVNPDAEKAHKVRVLALADLDPLKYVLEALEPALQQVKGFEKIVFTPPPPFELTDFRETPRLGITDPGKIDPGTIDPRVIDPGTFKTKPIDVAVKNFTRKFHGKYGRRKVPNVQADYTLEPNQVSTFTFKTDMERVKPGTAHIIHLRHINEDKRVIGGLTLVTVKV